METRINSLRMPPLVYCGDNALETIERIIQSGEKVVVFTDGSILANGLLEKPLAYLERAGAKATVFDDLATEPSVYEAEKTIRRFRAEKADLIMAVGGGSVMDVAKLCSILDTDEYTIFDLLENPAAAHKTVRTVMIPTTAGTGSEATPNAIVLVPEKELKIGIVNPAMIADAIILDASLLLRLPPKICAATGIDALAHAIECYTSNKATPFSDLFALGALKLIHANLWKAYDEPDCLEAKRNMLLASFYAGVSIAAAGTTAVHALSYPLGGKYHIAHGVSNAMLLAPVMRFNMPCCKERLAEVYQTLYPERPLESCEAEAEFVICWLEKTVRHLEIPDNLRSFGVPEDDLELLVTLGMEVKRLLNNNCREVSAEDARRLYSALLTA